MFDGLGCVDDEGVPPGNDHWYELAFCDVLVKFMHEPLQRMVSLEKKPATGEVQLVTVINPVSVCDDEQ